MICDYLGSGNSLEWVNRFYDIPWLNKSLIESRLPDYSWIHPLFQSTDIMDLWMGVAYGTFMTTISISNVMNVHITSIMLLCSLHEK